MVDPLILDHTRQSSSEYITWIEQVSLENQERLMIKNNPCDSRNVAPLIQSCSPNLEPEVRTPGKQLDQTVLTHSLFTFSLINSTTQSLELCRNHFKFSNSTTLAQRSHHFSWSGSSLVSWIPSLSACHWPHKSPNNPFKGFVATVLEKVRKILGIWLKG